jgi:DNA-binding response OmpR family regulator
MMQKQSPFKPAIVKILVVDDVEANRALLCRRLNKAGFLTEAVDSGMAALQTIEQSIPDIVLLDYMMPAMNGVEVLKQLRDRDATKMLPVIMVTARTEGEAVVEALSAGADDYVTKPIDFEVLHARMASQLNKKRDAVEIRRTNNVLDERVIIRSMALADIQNELQEEIAKRHRLEEKLACLQEQARRKTATSEHIGMSAILIEIERLVSTLFTAASEGQGVNLASLVNLKEKVAEARSQITG